MTINIKADGVPDGAYGPFNFNCMLTVKDGVVVLTPILPVAEVGALRLKVLVGQDNTVHATLTFEHAPTPEPLFEVGA